MSKIWFSADPHHFHSNIIRLCNRPFADVNEMNAQLISRWNQKVSPEDTVWLLGDFSWGSGESAFNQLNGNKHLIIGNHDPRETLALPWASQPCDYKEIDVVDDEGVKSHLVLFHYGIRSWNKMYRGSIHLHGHSHGNLPGFQTTKDGGTLDVGVDCWDFYPISLSEIKARLKTLPKLQPENSF